MRLFLALLGLVCGLALMAAATDTLQETEDIYIEDDEVQNKPGGMPSDSDYNFDQYDDDDDYDEDSYDDNDGDYDSSYDYDGDNDISYYYDDEDEDGSGSGEPEDSVDDIRPVAPIHREHLSLPDGYRPIADSENVNGTVPRAVLEAHAERESSSHDKIIILACIVGSCVLLFLIVVLFIVMVSYYRRGGFSRQKSQPIYKYAYKRAVSREYV